MLARSVSVGTRFVISSRTATYIGKPGLTGFIATVTEVRRVANQGAPRIAITSDLCGEIHALPEATIETLAEHLTENLPRQYREFADPSFGSVDEIIMHAMEAWQDRQES